MTNLNGFIARSKAQTKYDRSKNSFIRDVDQVCKRGNLDFLQHFMVVMKDGYSRHFPFPCGSPELSLSRRREEISIMCPERQTLPLSVSKFPACNSSVIASK